MSDSRLPPPSGAIGTVAIIGGTGRLGTALARRLLKAGLPVIIGSRDAAKARSAAASVGSSVRAAVNNEAAQAAGVVIVAVPYRAHKPTLQSLGTLTGGRIVVDTAVPIAEGGRVERVPAGSLAQEAAEILAGARVIAAFHTVSASMLNDLNRQPHGDVLICGDNPEAKAVVSSLVLAIGMRPVDAGGLSEAHTLEQVAALLLAMNRRYRSRNLGITIAGLEE